MTVKVMLIDVVPYTKCEQGLYQIANHLVVYYAGKLSDEGMKNLEIYAADLHKARQQNSKKDGMSTVHSLQFRV